MIKRDQLVDFIHKTIGYGLLEKSRQKDDFANGVQIIGSEPVTKVSLGVSLNEEFLEKAVSWGSNFCIFHHALSEETHVSLIPKYLQGRLRCIFKNDLTIVGLHYALDAHPKIGNNVLIIKNLGARVEKPFADEWGYIGTFKKPIDLHELGHACQELFNHEIFVVAGGKPSVEKIGVVSGAGKPKAAGIFEMQKEEVELLITGETSEHLPHIMKEEGINYFVCGHYATEVFGVKALGEEIKKNFGKKLQVKFIDVENPI